MKDTIALLAGWLAVGLFVAALAIGIKRGILQLKGKTGTGKQPHALQLEQPESNDYIIILAWVVVSGLFVYAFGMWYNAHTNDLSLSLPDLFRDSFIRSDASHYLSIAEFGYQTEGDPRFFIVFFPLFPWMVRALQVLTGSYLSAAILLNNVFLYMGCVVVYKLGCMDYGRKTALRAVRLMLLFPTAFFFRSAFTESLFLLLTASALYCCRKERFVWAGLLGGLAALTRMTGLIVLGVIIIEAFMKAWELNGGWNKGLLLDFAKRAWPFALVLCGAGIYLLVNKVVTGDAFTFSVYQKEHWFNEFRPFFHQVKDITGYALDLPEANSAALWRSQALAMLFFPLLILYGSNKVRVSHTAYNLAYYFTTTSISWLLSAPRYLMCMFPAFYALSMPAKNLAVDIALSLLSFAGLAYMTALFCAGYHIY